LSGDYDAVILDVMMPRLSGTEALRRIRTESPIPVIMLTAKGDDIDRVIGLELGADDYVPKPYFPRELVARLRAVLRRRPAAGPPQTAQSIDLGSLHVDIPTRRALARQVPVELTASEFNLLVVLLQAGDAVATKDDLSLKVLGRPRASYDRSVDVHVSNLRQKLGIAAPDIEIETVRGIGYRIRASR
jgi:two-component system OmpR family response regulator